MTTSITSLLEEVTRNHFPYPPATPAQIEEFEQRSSWTLDPDLRAFYLHCNGAEFFKRLPDAPYQVLPLAEIVRARVAMRGEDSDKWGPPSMYAICDVQDGNYVVADVRRQVNGRYPLINGYHEAWPDPEYCDQIASSFSEFLEKVLRSKGHVFYLQSGAS